MTGRRPALGIKRPRPGFPNETQVGTDPMAPCCSRQGFSAVKAPSTQPSPACGPNGGVSMHVSKEPARTNKSGVLSDRHTEAASPNWDLPDRQASSSYPQDTLGKVRYLPVLDKVATTQAWASRSPASCKAVDMTDGKSHTARPEAPPLCRYATDNAPKQTTCDR